jgi:hypothetical protein
MKAQLRVLPHSELPGERVVEVHFAGQLVCTVVGADGPGVRIISKYRPQIDVMDAFMAATIWPMSEHLYGQKAPAVGAIQVLYKLSSR